MRRPAALLLALLLLCPAALGAEDAPATRGDFLIALWESDGGVPFDVTNPFTDVDYHDPWAVAVGWACGEGLVNGVGEGLFAPTRPITREEAAVLLRRWAGVLGRPTFLPDGVAECNDYEDISPWADDSLYWACDAGLLDWSQGSRLDPLGSMTREEVALVLHRFAREQ